MMTNGTSAMHGANTAPDSDNLAVALALAKAGLPIFPAAVKFNEGKKKWDKAPYVKGWQDEATTDELKLREWWRAFPQAVPGIELGRAGLVAIDTDRHGGEDGVAALSELVEQHVPLPDHPVATTAGDGEHHYFKQWNGETFGNSEGLLHGKGINVRGRGGWAVAPGSMRRDGKRWSPAGLSKAYLDSTIPVLPDWIAAMIRAARKPEAEAEPTTNDRPAWSAAEETRVRAALDRIPSQDRTTWFEVGAALHWTGWPVARAIWDTWSQTTPGAYDEDDQEKTWRSFDGPYTGNPKTLASLFHLAQANGYDFSAEPRRDDPAAPGEAHKESSVKIS
jgi:Bifunctional DNA primase/polymerase, N-terminal/Primase C terminal 2 (PriCT-2)